MSGEHSFFFITNICKIKMRYFTLLCFRLLGVHIHNPQTHNDWKQTVNQLLLEAVSNMDFTVINRSVYSEMILHWMYIYSWLLTTNITLLFLLVCFLYSNCHFTINGFRILKNCCRYSSGSKFNSMYMYINICIYRNWSQTFFLWNIYFKKSEREKKQERLQNVFDSLKIHVDIQKFICCTFINNAQEILVMN